MDITAITGIDTTNGLELFTEVGADLSAWETEKLFTSWLGFSPNPHASGGKRKSSQTRKVTNRASWAFRMAVKAAAKSKTSIEAFYRRLKARVGAPKAMTATARKIAVMFYHRVTDKTPYHDLGEEYDMKQNRERALKQLQREGFGLHRIEPPDPQQAFNPL